MTTVKQLREFLAKCPDDAQVRVLKEVTRNYETFTRWEDLKLPETEAEQQMLFSDNFNVWGKDDKDDGFLDLGEQ